jgi:alpha-tubulin suppressor-like RCC1 family protein
MHTRSYLAVSALLLAALGCREDAGAPTEPGTAPTADISTLAALSFSQVDAGGAHTCAVTDDHQVYCWGLNSYGQLGDGTRTGAAICENYGVAVCSTRPVAVLGGLRFRSLSTGLLHTCGVTIDDRAYCWGLNSDGQLGDGTTIWRSRPVPVGGNVAFRQVSAGQTHTCGKATSDQVYCWGDNGWGKLGDGTTTPRLLPVPVAGARKFRQVSAGYNHSCGVTTTGEAFCWGSNHFAQIGDSSTAVERRRPARVAGGHQFRQLDAGGLHTCAVTTGNRAYCWGYGADGEIGDGKPYRGGRYYPRPVRGGLYFHRVTAGEEHSCGETTTNRAYCWGRNAEGRLADGTTTDRLSPVPVAGGLYFKQVSAGAQHTCGKTPASAAYCWGANDDGQLGDGTTTGRLIPVPVVGPL